MPELVFDYEISGPHGIQIIYRATYGIHRYG